MITGVPLLDLRRVDSALDDELVETFKRVLTSGQYVLGPEVEGFEAECAAYLGCKHAIGVSSGTDALLLALMALGVGHGDEVICPTFSFFATAGAVWRTGARPVFVDSSPDDFNVAADQIKAKLTPRTRAVIPVHLFGQVADMEAVRAASGAIPIVEDAAQALGAGPERRAGTLGAFGCFSFFPSKNLGGLGDSGLLVTSNDDLAERARVLRAHGSKPKYFHQAVGGNFRIDALQAALLRPKLRRLEAWTQRRRNNARLYSELFSQAGIAETPLEGEGTGTTSVVLPRVMRERHIYNQFCIRLPLGRTRDALKAHLHKRRIGTEVYYPLPLHLQPCFSSLGHGQGDFPMAERMAQECLALPIFPELKPQEIQYVVDCIAEFFDRAG